MDFQFRGVEFHSNRIWQTAQVERAMQFMEKFSMNALIFHQNDLIDQLVFPETLFDDDLMWKRWPVRMHTIYNNRKYMNKVINEGKRRGIDIYLEVKEFSFPESLLIIHPELKGPNGDLCPNNPFWFQLAEDRMEELCEALPGLGGVIISVGTRESKVSISTNNCGCELCQHPNKAEWYYKAINAFHKPLQKHGKKLIVRDFSYSAEDQSLIVSAADRCSDDIIIGLKITPHDFYPTFPTNAHIGHTGNHPQFIEFDTWGQFFGMGGFPVSVADDMQKRLRECKEKGATGAWFRTDWEVITECSTANTPNMLNLYAAAILTANVETPLDEIYKKWTYDGFVSPMYAGSYIPETVAPTSPDAWKNLKKFMEESWEAMVRAAYILGNVYLEDDQIPDTVKKGFKIMIEIHSMEEYAPGVTKKIVAKEENFDAIFKEKEEAKKIVSRLADILSPHEIGFPKQTADELLDMIDLYSYYVDMIEISTRATYYAQYALDTKDKAAAARAAAVIPELKAFDEKLEKRLEGSNYPHYYYWLLDNRRIKCLYKDMEEKLAGI